MKVVVDASVIVKWLFADRREEPDIDLALRLMRSVVTGEIEVLQPPHWLAEVAAVLARLSPETASDDVELLHAMALPVSDDAVVLRRACKLAIASRQHLFDTLYHAVALETDDAMLVTADARYLLAAHRLGRVCALTEWSLNS